MHRMRESGRRGVGECVMCVCGYVCGCAVCKDKAASLPFALTAGCCHRRWKASAPRHQPEREARESSSIVSQWQ